MRKFTASEAFLARAEKVIPLGSQTFSKSRTQYPFGVSPYFITRGQGSRVWDLDGNEYIDFVSSLASVTLGYQDADATSVSIGWGSEKMTPDSSSCRRTAAVTSASW